MMYEEKPDNPLDNSNSGSETGTSGKSLAAKSKARAEQKLTCPYCRKTFIRSATESMPFCSPRCKQIDLGLWLNESHGVPFEADPERYNDHDFE